VIVHTNGGHFAVPVDELIGQQLVLLRPLQGVLSSIRHMSGVAILSGGEIGLVLSVSALMPEEQRGAA
jgi:two-component system, chemotaxis family, sensor kinase CheA